MPFMKRKKASVIGVDIGSYAVKCAEVTAAKDTVLLNHFSVLPISENSPEAPVKLLKQFFETLPVKPERVRLAVSGSSLFTRRITLPIMTHAELKGAIRFEAENHVPFPIEECVLDFQILNQVPNQAVMNVMLVAAKRDFIQSKLETLASLNLVPEIIDMNVFCLGNAFEVSSQAREYKTFGLLNIGHETSGFVIFQESLPYFVREIARGALGVTQALAGLKGIPETDADQKKKSTAAEDAGDLRMATEKGFGPLVEELKSSIDFFEGETQENVPWVGLSGGGALSHDAAPVLEAALGRKVSLWDLSKKIKCAKEADTVLLGTRAVELDVALGLALRGWGIGT